MLGSTLPDRFRAHISPATQLYGVPEPFVLESDLVLEGVQVAYRTWGTLNRRGDNAVLVCHAFTGGADADNWWEPLFGLGKTLDPHRDFIVCSNILGSCYGTTGPTSLNPQTGQPYGPNFPFITIRDMVRLQAALLEALSVQQLQLVLGGSLGGMQALEWALVYPERVRAIAPIAVSGKHSAWCIGWSEAQRQAIYADPLWQNGHYSPNRAPAAGLSVARMIAMSTYRAWASFEDRFGRQQDRGLKGQEFAVANYLQFQGQRLGERFDANTYIRLTEAMDSHDVGRDRGNYASVLSHLQQPTLIVSISSDILYPPSEQEELAELIPGAELVQLHSPHGHDAFLMEMDILNCQIVRFRDQVGRQALQ